MSNPNRGHRAGMTTPILPSGAPQGTGAGWGLVFAGYLAVLLMVFGHEPSPKVDPPPAPASRPTPVAQPEEEAPPPMFPEEEEEPEPEPEPEPEAEPEPEVIPVDDDCLDEVGCLLAEEMPACCKKYSRRQPPVDSELPETLDKEAVLAGVAKVKSEVMACGRRHPADGLVKLTVTVAPSGRVSTVSVAETPHPRLGQCAAGAMKRARFIKTQQGVSFKFPFMFSS